MLAHAASAQGISAVENMCGREHVLDHNTVPAACFTHPEVSELFHSVHALISMTQRLTMSAVMIVWVFICLRVVSYGVHLHETPGR